MKKLIHSVKASEELPVYSDLYTPEDLLELLSQITELGESPVGMLPTEDGSVLFTIGDSDYQILSSVNISRRNRRSVR